MAKRKKTTGLRMPQFGTGEVEAYLQACVQQWCLLTEKPRPRDWPVAVVQIPTALQSGEDCHFALHDALLDAGVPELAEHFREKRIHHAECCVLKGIPGQTSNAGLDVTNVETPPDVRELIFGDPNAPRPQGILQACRATEHR